MACVIAIFFIYKDVIVKNHATKSTERRIICVLSAFFVFAAYILTNILRLDFFNYEFYKDKTYDQVTTTSPLIAKRGNIYDSNMNALAASYTKWRIFVSPKELKNQKSATGTDYAKLIAIGLGPILSRDSAELYNKINSSSVLDLTLEKSANEETYRAALNFAMANGLEKYISFEASSSRYYPKATMAAHLLGFVGSDNQGLYGLEYYYDKTLSGTNGYYVYAKDANGNELDTEYSDYVPAEDGYSLVTTLDSYLQSELEAILELARVTHKVENRLCGIAMDTSTGAILAMATSSPFNPNSPFVLDEQSLNKLNSSGLAYGSEEYKKYKNELLSVMWSNKAVSETYEPGSTFKIITVSAALDSGAASTSDTFSCSGSAKVGGWNIRCHKRTGHGSGFSLAYGLQMSCNPCMISISKRLGSERFYSYVEKFGYLEKTGIDLPSEASTIFHSEDKIGETELATASFGQRFKVSIINQLTAIAAVANNGKLVTPYVVDKIIDNNGNVISVHEPEIKREVISAQTAKEVSKILAEGVSGDGGAKNAAVSGYDIAAKTGTSEKFDILDENGNSYLRIGSTVAYSTDENHGIAVIIVADEPTSDVKYGSVVAAPYVSKFLEKALPYLEFKSTRDENTTVENLVGMSIETAKEKLNASKTAYEIVGNGSVVLSQTPSGNDSFNSAISKVILYTENTLADMVKAPKLIGMKIKDAVKLALNTGLNIRFTGTYSSECIITEQSISEGALVKRGTVITLRTVSQDFED